MHSTLDRGTGRKRGAPLLSGTLKRGVHPSMPSFSSQICQLDSGDREESLWAQGDGTASKQKKPGSLSNPYGHPANPDWAAM